MSGWGGLSRWRRGAGVMLVVLVGLSVTGVAYASVEAGEDRYAGQIMDRYSDEIADAITDRVTRYGDTVGDLAYAIGAQSELTADDFARITAGLDAARLPGASALAFLVPATNARSDAVQRRWRAAGVGGLVLRPQAGQPVHEYVIFEKAFDENDMRGIDVSASPPVVAALATAQHSNALAVSPAYPALRDTAVAPQQRQNSVVLAMPVYSGLGSADPDTFLGWVTMGLRGQDFLARTLHDRGQDTVQVSVTDPNGSGAVIAAVTPGTRAAETSLTRQRSVMVGQRRWHVTVRPTHRLMATADRGTSELTAAAGAVLTLLLAAITAILTGSRDRALAQVAEATAALKLDITRREHVEAQLQQLAFHDPLTGLANRALFYDRLTHAVATHARRNRTFAVLFIDLDGFKQINDQRGHQAGDAVLREVATRLRAGLRAGDTVARFGGDEFAIILEALTAEADARGTAERVIDRIHQPIDVDGTPATVSASVGIAVHQPGTSADDTLRHADAAMYAAKSAGKNRYVEATA